MVRQHDICCDCNLYFRLRLINIPDIFRYEGSAGLIPSSNNGIESINAQIKGTWLGRRLEAVGDFLPKVVEMVNYWSTRAEQLGIPQVPAISRSLWHEAYKLLTSDEYYMEELPQVPGQQPRFVISRKQDHHLSPLEYAEFFDNPAIATWGDFTQVLQRDWHVVSVLPAGWATCSCRAGLKEYRCKHSVAVEVSIEHEVIPEDVLPLRGGVRKRVGRPKKIMGGYGK